MKTGFIRRQRKFSNGEGMLGKRMEAGAVEAMAKELGLWDIKLTLPQANSQAMATAQLQDISEILNMRG